MKNIGICYALFLLIPVILTSCSTGTQAGKPDEIRLAYSGSAFDLPLVAAYQNGYFEEEGLKVTLVPVKEGELGKSIREGIVDGGTADAGILEEMDAGLQAKIGGGVRGACVEILALKESGLTEVKDLEGKKIGIKLGEGGTAEAAAALEVLEKYKVKGILSVDWVYMERADLPAALEEKYIDALVRWQGEDMEIPEGVSVIYQNSSGKEGGSGGHSHGDNPHFYESFAVLSEELAVNYPKSASVLLAAWMKGVNSLALGTKNQLERAEEGGFITDTSQNEELKCYMFMPGIKTVPQNLKSIARLKKNQGLLGEEIEVEEFIDRVFVKLLPDWG